MVETILAMAASHWVLLALFLFCTIDGFFPPVPSESVVIALASLSVAGLAPSLWLILPVAALGAFCGDVIAYLIGTRVPIRRLRLFRTKRGARALAWAESALQRRGGAFILSARYIPIGRVAVNMTAGAVGFGFRRFVGFAALAAVTWSLYSVLLGVGAGAVLHDHPIIAVLVGVLVGVVMGTIIDLVMRRFFRRAGLDPHGPGPSASAGADGDDDPEPAPGPGVLERTP
ncbi:DedA family protein [Occultella glacieicola]|uniref:DedA family protein n=1 Tax=Occultella glacieicola TaxID=2518684 RepID=A0ABY2E868_9MICO|nr:DedA family protein [Occultella glacieicola]TDE97638.1 DedA family protein [Occultella glacieicola]